jgi:hypothetical protein
VFVVSCGVHYATPSARASDARFGRIVGTPPSRAELCRDWAGAMRTRDPHAVFHTSYPESDPTRSCFVPVRYSEARIEVGSTPPGCAYPSPEQVRRLDELGSELEAMRSSANPAPRATLLPCGITTRDRDAALEHNARVFHAAAERLARPDAAKYPYAAVITFGYGWPDQAETSLADWRPDERCHRLSQRDLDRMGPMLLRTRRVAEALRAGIAPLAIVSGGTEHSRMVEAFAMLFLLRCGYGIPSDRVVLEPCAEHTHTNIRNSGRWLVAMGARTGYIVTDDGLQRDYLEEFSGFELVFGSLDQRSLRDWGYLIGSWRRAAEGPNVGFWYTPYRFWAEPNEALRSLTCVDEPR